LRLENNVCNELKKWFNSFNIDCWLNEGKEKFTTKGSQKKPDIVIYSKKLLQHIAIEVKVGNNNTALRNSVKIIDYWKHYVNGKTKYYIKRNEIKISSFCVATLGSMNGKLYLNETNYKDSFNDGKTPWKLVQLKYKLEPRYEYIQSKEFLRLLWTNWKRIRGKEQPGIGIILSDILNQGELEKPRVTKPLLFDMQWRISFRNKPQWRQKNLIL